MSRTPTMMSGWSGFDADGAPDPVLHAKALLHWRDAATGGHVSMTVRDYVAQYPPKDGVWHGPWVETAWKASPR